MAARTTAAARAPSPAVELDDAGATVDDGARGIRQRRVVSDTRDEDAGMLRDRRRGSRGVEEGGIRRPSRAEGDLVGGDLLERLEAVAVGADLDVIADRLEDAGDVGDVESAAQLYAVDVDLRRALDEVGEFDALDHQIVGGDEDAGPTFVQDVCAHVGSNTRARRHLRNRSGGSLRSGGTIRCGTSSRRVISSRMKG